MSALTVKYHTCHEMTNSMTKRRKITKEYHAQSKGATWSTSREDSMMKHIEEAWCTRKLTTSTWHSVRLGQEYTWGKMSTSNATARVRGHDLQGWQDPFQGRRLSMMGHAHFCVALKLEDLGMLKGLGVSWDHMDASGGMAGEVPRMLETIGAQRSSWKILAHARECEFPGDEI